MVNSLTCHTGINVIVFYIVGFIVSTSIIWLFSIMLNVEKKMIKSISQGTILILAVHLAMIDSLTYKYNLSMVWSLVASVVIMAICVILTFIAKHYCPILLGKKFPLKQ